MRILSICSQIISFSLIFLVFQTCSLANEKNKIDDREIIFFTQENYSPLDLSDFKISNHIAFQQHWFRFPVNMTKEEFVKSNDAKAIARIKRLLDEDRVPSPNMHMLIDLEGVNASRNFTKFLDDSSFDIETYFKKLKLRFDTVREFFPNAKIGAYGYPIPTGNQVTFESLNDYMRGIHAAAEFGVLDNVDYIWVNAYQRFGPDDLAYERILKYTEASLLQAKTVRRSDGTMPLVGVLYSQRVFNAPTHTKHANEVHVDAVRKQRELVARLFPNVTEAVWDGDGVLAGAQWWHELFAK